MSNTQHQPTVNVIIEDEDEVQCGLALCDGQCELVFVNNSQQVQQAPEQVATVVLCSISPLSITFCNTTCGWCAMCALHR